ncbi:MAG: hypothetical protein V4662_08450 [Verrucomicrobiota bacterium]
MTPKFHRLQTGQLREFARVASSATSPTLMPSEFWHIYIKLDFQKRYENAENKEDGRSFVKNVARAASAAEITLRQEDGLVIEVQGSVIHCLILDQSGDTNLVRQQCRAINNALHFVFSDASIVEGWRMTADWGKTLLVRGRGIHNDDSYVSLGNAANAPAKHLYAQLARPSEGERQLKRYTLGWRRGSQSPWFHEPLPVRIDEEFQKRGSTELSTAKAKDFSVTSAFTKQARAAPGIHSGGELIQLSANPSVQTQEEPSVHFGWVMRADLDGFTARVEGCYDDDSKLLRLGQDFEAIMDTAARFAAQHDELLIQLPWAGDNFTAVVTFSNRDAYQDAIERRYIEFSLDFDDALRDVTRAAALPGWAQTTAGGDVHGNAQGNVYVGSVEFEGRRFLIGAGQGVGRSAQAFSDMNPVVEELVILDEDYPLLLKPYQSEFANRRKHDGGDSTLFRKADLARLAVAHQQIENALVAVAKPAVSSVTLGSGAKAQVSSRPYATQESTL